MSSDETPSVSRLDTDLALSILDQGAFQRTAALFSPKTVADYLQIIVERCEALLRELDEVDVLGHAEGTFAETAHSLAVAPECLVSGNSPRLLAASRVPFRLARTMSPALANGFVPPPKPLFEKFRYLAPLPHWLEAGCMTESVRACCGIAPITMTVLTGSRNLETRPAAPAKTPDNASIPPSKGQKSSPKKPVGAVLALFALWPNTRTGSSRRHLLPVHIAPTRSVPPSCRRFTPTPTSTCRRCTPSSPASTASAASVPAATSVSPPGRRKVSIPARHFDLPCRPSSSTCTSPRRSAFSASSG
jgi:hypothetical protein